MMTRGYPTAHGLALLLLVALPSAAHADAIPPPEDLDCRPGERLVTDHGGTRCELPLCQTQADCPEGTRCPTRYCFAMVPSGVEGCPGSDSKEPPDPCDPVPERRQPCADAAPQCPDGERCAPGRCEWTGTPPAPIPRPPSSATVEDPDSDEGQADREPSASEPRSGGGCFGSRGTSGAAWPLLMLGTVGIVFGRRRAS